MLRDNNLQSFFLKTETILLCLYIILAPISKCVQIYMFGYNIIVVLIILLCLNNLLCRLLSNNLVFGNFSFILLAVYLTEILFLKNGSSAIEMGVLLSVFLYISFLSLRDISLKWIYYSFFIAAFLSAIYSFIYGTEGGSVTRTAVYVDGSISVITLAIVLFGTEKAEYGAFFKFMKGVAFFSALAVLLFGMSRARIAIAVVIFVLWLLRELKHGAFIGNLDFKKVAVGCLFLLLLFALRTQPIFQELIASVTERFDDGFLSLGRNDEIHVGVELFKNNILFGAGWGTLSFIDYVGNMSNYYNHCMYVAVFARGGLLFAIPFYLSVLSVLKKSLFDCKNFTVFMLIAIFSVLGYGNAGMFNYTICSALIPALTLINTKEENVNEKNNICAETGA